MISFDRRLSASASAVVTRGRVGLGFTLTALIAVVLALVPTPVSAGLVLQVENASAQAGGTGSFDVVLAATSGSFAVSAFSVELSVDSGSGVTFTGASVNTTSEPYIFTTLQAPPLTFGSFPTFDFTASDSDMTSPGYVTLSAAGTAILGVENVTFDVTPGTPAGPIVVSIVSGFNTTVLDVNANSLPFTTADGTITVGASAVPEPSALIQGVTAAAMVLIVVGFGSRFRR